MVNFDLLQTKFTMSKSTFFTGQPIFGQLLHFIPQSLIASISIKHNSDYYCKRFKTYEHLVTMLYSIYNKCDSLREISTGLLACGNRLGHLRLNHIPRRSTIADANCRRSAKVFESIYYALLKKYQFVLSDSRRKSLNSRVYLFDSTVITLFHEVLEGLGLPDASGRRKGGIKVHTLIRSDQDVASMVLFSAAKANDSNFLKHIHLPKGSIVVFDRGYNDYNTYNRFAQEGVSWVTRLRKRIVYSLITNKEVTELQKSRGIISDQLIEMGHTYKKSATRVKARLITHVDAESGRIFQFLTNNLRMSPATIAGLYKKRWQIELLFKRIKQNYPLRYFLGESQNAIEIQIWCALIGDLILKVIKNGFARKWAFSNLTSMVRIHLLTYINLQKFLKSPEKALSNLIRNPQIQFAQELFPK